MAGFYFNDRWLGNKDDNSIKIVVQCYCKRTIEHYMLFQQLTKEYLEGKYLTRTFSGNGYQVWFEEPLHNFIDCSDQYKNISKWFIEKLHTFKEFAKNTKELNWHIDFT